MPREARKGAQKRELVNLPKAILRSVLKEVSKEPLEKELFLYLKAMSLQLSPTVARQRRLSEEVRVWRGERYLGCM
jgi:hypothetical protein